MDVLLSSKAIYRLIILGIFALPLFMYSCAYNNEEELYPPEVCDTTGVTYSGTIAPLIEQRCYDCHDEEAVISGISLAGYDNLKVMVDADRIIGALRHLSGYSFMPKDLPALPECDIERMEKWIADGAPNN